MSTTRPRPSGWSTCSRPPTRSTGHGTRGTPRPWSRSWPRTDGTATPSCSSWAETPTEPLVAAGWAVLPTRDNLNAALVGVRVVPAHRGKGVGSAFVEHLERVAAAAGRTRLFGGGPESDAGRRFAEAHGYAVASVGMTRRVDLGEVSAEAVQAAYDEAEPHAREYELVRLAGPLPTELMEAYVEAVSAINDAPLDDLDVDDEVFDGDRVRAYEQGQLLSGHRLYRVLARHREPARSPGIPSSPSRPSDRTSATSTTRPSSARIVATGSGCCSRPT